MRGAAHQNRGEGISIDIAVICQNPGGRDQKFGILIASITVVLCERSIIDRLHVNRDGRWRRIEQAIIYFVAKTVRSKVVRRAQIPERAVRIERQCSMSRAADQDW